MDSVCLGPLLDLHPSTARLSTSEKTSKCWICKVLLMNHEKLWPLLSCFAQAGKLDMKYVWAIWPERMSTCRALTLCVFMDVCNSWHINPLFRHSYLEPWLLKIIPLINGLKNTEQSLDYFLVFVLLLFYVNSNYMVKIFYARILRWVRLKITMRWLNLTLLL